jgi:hypothetical protein
MEAEEMMDVIHFFFEDEMSGISPEGVQAREALRKSIYEDFYGVPYAHDPSSQSNGTRNFDEPLDSEPEEAESPVNPFNPRKQAVVPYTPATSFNPDAVTPFGDLLDAPIN